MSFAKNLTAARIRMNYSSKEVANMIGVSATTYSNYELGLREPKFDILKKIAEVLQISTDYLLSVDIDARNQYFLNQAIDRLKELDYFEVLNPFDYYNYGEFNLCFSIFGYEDFLHLPSPQEQSQLVAFRKADLIKFMEDAAKVRPELPFQIAQRDILKDYISSFLTYEGPYNDWLDDLSQITKRSESEHPEIIDLFVKENRAKAQKYTDVVCEIKGFLSRADADFIIKKISDMTYLYNNEAGIYSDDSIDPELLSDDYE